MRAFSILLYVNLRQQTSDNWEDTKSSEEVWRHTLRETEIVTENRIEDGLKQRERDFTNSNIEI